MITDKDLIGTWKIIKTVLKKGGEQEQKEIDSINSIYSIEYKTNNKYSESNNGIVVGRLSNFSGRYTIESNILNMSIKSIAFNRKYIVESAKKDNSEIKFSPLDTMYCSIYSNIDYLILKKS